MLKSILKFLAAIVAFVAAIAAFSHFSRSKSSDYIEIYSSDDDYDDF